MMKKNLTILPRHIGIIMDGNGRWAQKRLLPRPAGHRAGVKTLGRVVKAVFGLGVPYLTVYAFSTENAARPDAEVRGLLGIVRRYFDKELPSLIKNGIRVRVIGDRAYFDEDIRHCIAEAERQTAGFTERTFVVALNYGARDEIVRAVNRLLGVRGQGPGASNSGQWSVVSGQIREDVNTVVEKPETPQKPITDHCPLSTDHRTVHCPLTTEQFAACLDTAGIPDPDMIIRTGGEQRLSNFLLYQAAYAELFFIPDLWPDFTKERLNELLEEYGKRSRRFGK